MSSIITAIGIASVVAGSILVGLGASGHTELTPFGVGAIYFGATLVMVNVYHNLMARSINHINAARSIHNLALWTTTVIGLTIVVAGVALVWLGATGGTELTLFGNTFKSETVGAVGMFCGAVLVILNVRRVMRSVERLGALPDEAAPSPRKRRR